MEDIEREYLEKRKIKKVYLENERVYFKKSFFGWRVVFPIKIDGKTNIKNLVSGGHWGKIGLVILFILICLGAMYEYYTALKLANACLAQLPDYVQLIIP